MYLLDLYFWGMSVNCALGVFMNISLIMVIQKYTRPIVGGYKILLTLLAVLDCVYAATLWIGMPIHFLYDRDWIIFSNGIVKDLSYFGPGLYCALYELWILLLDAHFIYRYISVCRPYWLERFGNHTILKAFIWINVIFWIFYTTVCQVIFCTAERMRPDFEQTLLRHFGFPDNHTFGYLMLVVKNSAGEFSFLGAMSIINHALFASISFFLMLFCGQRTWSQIIKWASLDGYMRRNVRLEKQLFLTLLIQTLIPSVLSHIPTMVYTSFNLWGYGITFGSYSVAFAYGKSVNKFLDPLVAILCIRDYRKAVFGSMF